MVEFITMAPTSGDGEYVGAVDGAEQVDGWTGTGGNAARPATREYITSVVKQQKKTAFLLYYYRWSGLLRFFSSCGWFTCSY